MEPKTTLAGLGATAIIMGGVEVSVLDEQPIDQINIIANERVEAKQINNEVTASLPWKEERGLNIKYDMGEPTIVEKFKDKRNEQVITEVVDNSQGFKMDIILNKKPANNCFTYQIDGWEDYDFFYQPPLTPEEIAEGAERPEEIVGSYAVYHKTLKNHETSGINYATGKVAHIPYPYVWEVNNEVETKQRAESFDITDGNMTVCAPQNFLDNATYPVRIDPTFGYTTIGGTSVNISNATTPGINLYTSPAEAGDIISISTYVTGFGVGELLGNAIYDTSGNLLAEDEGDATGGSDGWQTTNFSYTFSASTGYWLGKWITGNHNYNYDAGGTDNYRNETFETFENWPNPISVSTSLDRLSSIYATYTATEEATTTPVTTISGGTVISGGAVIR